MEKNLKRFLASSLTLTTFLTIPIIDSNNLVKASENKVVVSQMSTTDVLIEMEKLKVNYQEFLVGNEGINQSPLLDSKINSVHNMANTRLASYLAIEDRETSLFKDLPLGENDANLSNSYLYLYQMAVAAKTYKRPDLSGVNFYENEETIHKVIEGLD